MYLDSFPFVTVDIRFKTTELIWEQQSNSRQKTVVYYDFLATHVCVCECVHVCAFCAAAAAAALKRIWERNTRQDQKPLWAVRSAYIYKVRDLRALFLSLSLFLSRCVCFFEIWTYCAYTWMVPVFHQCVFIYVLVCVCICVQHLLLVYVRCMFEPVHFNANASFLSHSPFGLLAVRMCVGDIVVAVLLLLLTYLS